MTASRGPDERVVLPRWRTWRTSENQRELGSLKPGAGALDRVTTAEEAQRELNDRVEEFKYSPGLHRAADVVATAIVLGLEAQDEIHEAAVVMLNAPSPSARATAKRIVEGSSSAIDKDSEAEGPSEERLRRWIAKQKIIVRDQPRNVLAWTDLALAHTILGQTSAAKRSIHIALAQANGNRFVLRAAARFYVHCDDFVQAHHVLTSDVARLRSDPWLLAAQIAIADSSDQPQRHASHAKHLLEQGFAPHDLSELASALATIEIKSGKVKQAKRLISGALVDPTDNALAQAEWSIPKGVIVANAEDFDLPLNYEAMARYHYRNENFAEALVYGGRWLADQPFALDPAWFTSFVAATLVDDQSAAIRACEVGLKSNPHNPILLNNLAFSLANSGRLREAAQALERPMTDVSKVNSAIMTATRGLISFRIGDIDRGRALYRQAIEVLIRDKQNLAAASASLFWVFEELNAGSDDFEEASAVADSMNRLARREPELILSRRRLAKLAGKIDAPNAIRVISTLNLDREISV